MNHKSEGDIWSKYFLSFLCSTRIEMFHLQALFLKYSSIFFVLSSVSDILWCKVHFQTDTLLYVIFLYKDSSYFDEILGMSFMRCFSEFYLQIFEDFGS